MSVMRSKIIFYVWLLLPVSLLAKDSITRANNANMLQPPPLLCNVPHRNETYVSREEYENHLKHRLTIKNGGRVVVLVGMTGIGKTQLAKEYAHRHHKDYEIVWWFDASKDLNPQFREFAYE